MTEPIRAEVVAETRPMTLPEGESCGTCAHVKRCLMFGFTYSRKRRECDFYPVRFHKAIPGEAEKGGGS